MLVGAYTWGRGWAYCVKAAARPPHSKRLGRGGEFVFGSDDGGLQGGFVSVGNGQIDLEDGGEFRQVIRLRSDGAKMHEAATLWGVGGGVKRIGAPLDEKREQAVVIVVEGEALPVENFAVGTPARAGLRIFEGDVGFAKTRGDLSHVSGMNGPADDARLLQFAQAGDLRGDVLGGIGRHDLQVFSFTQRKQGVARAAAGMNAAECGAHTGVFLNEVDAAIEIVAAENEVIEQSRKIAAGPSDRRD